MAYGHAISDSYTAIDHLSGSGELITIQLCYRGLGSCRTCIPESQGSLADYHAVGELNKEPKLLHFFKTCHYMYSFQWVWNMPRVQAAS